MKFQYLDSMLPLIRTLSLTLATCFLACCDQAPVKLDKHTVSPEPKSNPLPLKGEAGQEVTKSSIVTAARSQVGKTIFYDPSYVGLKYPGGDLPIQKGVCTDVVVRALRNALEIDLQKLVHEDMKAAFSKYPTIWGLKKPDRNIDHRRVPNLRTFFKRKGYSLGISQKKKDYLPGDLVTCTVGGNRPHIMIVSDKQGDDGLSLVIHNIGSGTQEESRLFDFPITGHYRIKECPQTR